MLRTPLSLRANGREKTGLNSCERQLAAIFRIVCDTNGVRFDFFRNAGGRGILRHRVHFDGDQAVQITGKMAEFLRIASA
jgi:hypothetical protein